MILQSPSHLRKFKTKNNVFQSNIQTDPPDAIVKLQDTKFFRQKFERKTNFFPNIQISGSARQYCKISGHSKTWLVTK